MIKLFLLQSKPTLLTPALYRHLIITDSLLCPWGKTVLKLPLSYIFSEFNPVNTAPLSACVNRENVYKSQSSVYN